MFERHTLTDFDPFASAPADEAQAEPTPAATVKAPTRPAGAPSGEGKVVVTLKGGTGFDDPWIVIHAEDIADANSQIGEELITLMERTQNAAAMFRGKAAAKPAGTSKPAQAERPARQAPPDGAPEAPGDDWVFRSGVSAKTGKAWKAWMPPQGSDEKPVFF